MLDLNINVWAVVVSAVAAMVLGMIWWNPNVFGTIWMKAMGKTAKQLEKECKGKMPQIMGLQFVGSLLFAFVLGHFLNFTGATTVTDGFQTAFWLWLGFTVPPALSNVLYEGKPKEAFYIGMAYYLVLGLIVSAIFVMWV